MSLAFTWCSALPADPFSQGPGLLGLGVVVSFPILGECISQPVSTNLTYANARVYHRAMPVPPDTLILSDCMHRHYQGLAMMINYWFLPGPGFANRIEKNCLVRTSQPLYIGIEPSLVVLSPVCFMLMSQNRHRAPQQVNALAILDADTT